MTSTRIGYCSCGGELLAISTDPCDGPDGIGHSSPPCDEFKKLEEEPEAFILFLAKHCTSLPPQ